MLHLLDTDNEIASDDVARTLRRLADVMMGAPKDPVVQASAASMLLAMVVAQQGRPDDLAAAQFRETLAHVQRIGPQRLARWLAAVAAKDEHAADPFAS